MFDVSWGELVLIGMVALVVIGPKELPTVLRTMGQWMTKIRRMAAEFQGQFHEAMREAEMADLKKQVEGLTDPVKTFSEYNPLETTRSELEGALADKPAAETPAPAPAAETAASADAPPAAPAEAALPPAEPPQPAAPAVASEPGGRAA